MILTFIFAIINLGYVSQAFSQTSYKEVLFYVEAGETVEFTNSEIYIIQKNDNTYDNIKVRHDVKKNLKEKLYKEGNKYYLGHDWSEYKYDSKKSTQNYNVYRYDFYQTNTYFDPRVYGGVGCSTTYDGTFYIAISKNNKAIIRWYEEANNYDGNIVKTEYYNVPKSEFLPKSVNYDFLNE